MGHWRKVFAGAWNKSCKSLGWNKEKIVGVTVVFVGTVVVNGMRAGFDAVGNAKSVGIRPGVIRNCLSWALPVSSGQATVNLMKKVGESLEVSATDLVAALPSPHSP
jgi:hypothetical protein